MRYITVGLEFTLTFGAMLAGGMWLDSRLDTLPAFTIAGLAVGFAAGLTLLIRRSSSLRRADRDGGGDDRKNEDDDVR